MVPCKCTAKEVSFEWSHHRILPTDSKVTTTCTHTLHIHYMYTTCHLFDSGCKRVNRQTRHVFFLLFSWGGKGWRGGIVPVYVLSPVHGQGPMVSSEASSGLLSWLPVHDADLMAV